MPQQQAHNCPHCRGQLGKNEGLCKKHFDKLQKQWYAIASATGFEDAEKDGMLKEWASSNRNSISLKHAGPREARQEYYRMAGHFLYDYSFTDETELEIWKLHSQGVAIRDITKKILAMDPKNYKKTMVHVTIQRLSKVMRRLYSNG